MLTALPLPQASTAPHGKVSPEPTVTPAGKDSQGLYPVPPALWVASWKHPTLVLPHGDHRGICRAQQLGTWLWWRNGEGLITISTGFLADQLPICREVVGPSAEPTPWCNLNREPGRVQVCLTWALKGGVLPALRLCLPTHRQKSWVIGPPTEECGSQPHLTGRAGKNTWKLQNPAMFELRGWQS